MKFKYMKPETSILCLGSCEPCLAASGPVVKPGTEEDEENNDQLNYGGYGDAGNGLAKPNNLWEDTNW